MKCPGCGEEATLVTPDYGFGYGAEFRCYNSRCPRTGRYCEYTFSSRSEEAMAASNSARVASKANAEALRQEILDTEEDSVSQD